METKIVQLADHTTTVYDTPGAEPPIVLLHALSLDAHMFDSLTPLLSQHARVIAYDLRGHGSAATAPATTSLKQVAKDLAALLDALKIEAADIYGSSYGGCVAQYFAIRHPERVRSLALIATTSIAPMDMFLDRAVKAEQYGVLSLLDETLERWFSPTALRADTAAVRYARKCISRATAPNWADAWRAMAGLSALRKLRLLEKPVLVISGDKDRSTPPSCGHATVSECHGGEYKEVEGGTHMVVLERPEEVAKLLVEFRESIEEEVEIYLTPVSTRSFNACK